MALSYGSTTQRGYGGQHQRLRAQWKPAVDAGQAWCAELVCLEPSRWIPPGSPWHLAHDTGQHGYRGPAHGRCNIAEANRRRGGGRRRPGRRRQASAAVSRISGAATTSAPLRTSRRW